MLHKYSDAVPLHAVLLLQLVEQASKKFVCIVDESKLVDGLGGSKGDCEIPIVPVLYQG